MSNIQFDFNPLTPNSEGGGKFPWKTLLIGLGILAVIIGIAYTTSGHSLEESDNQNEGELPQD